MRNLKRVLSLALASVMLIGMMVVGASAANYDDFSDKDKIVNKEAVSTLVELGVIAGKDDGTYDPTGIVTRGEMAKMICVVLNGGKDPSLGNVTKYSYTDTVGHWAAPYIEYCAIRGIVAGKGDGTFGPRPPRCCWSPLATSPLLRASPAPTGKSIPMFGPTLWACTTVWTSTPPRA